MDKSFVLDKRRTYLLLNVLIISVISALRIFGYDRDYASYLNFYSKISFGGYSSRFEPGFEFFANVVKFIAGYDSFVLFLFILTFVSLYAKFSILSRVNYFPFLVLLYCMLILSIHEMMQIRVAIASGILFYAVNSSINKDISLIQKILWILLSISFHYSLIIIAPFVLFTNFFSKKSLLLIVLTMGIPALFISFSIEFFSKIEIVKHLVPMLDLYLVEGNPPNPFSSRMVTLLILLTIGLLHLKFLPSYALPWLYISFLGVGLFYGLMMIPTLAHRFLELTIFSYLVWVPSLPKFPRILGLSILFLFSMYFIFRISSYFTI